MEEDNYADEAPEIAGILKSQKVKGTALLELTSGDMKEMGIAMGPRKVLAKRIAALSAPPTAASGFQVGASAEREWRGAVGSLGKLQCSSSSGRPSCHGVHPGAGRGYATGLG